tara:strand:- start:131 stop:775 length:645 start_codon:yes stop_codon:yes gene_type:complete
VQASAQEVKTNPTNFSQLQEANIRLEEQNKILSESVSEFRVYLFSSLGFSATFLIVFLGVNIYFLRNRYTEDKVMLLQTIENKINQFEGKSLDRYEVAKKQQKEEISREIDQKSKKLEIENIYRRIDITCLQLKLEENLSICLSKYFKLAEDYNLLNWEMQLSDSLHQIIKLLNQGGEYDSSEYPEVYTFLDKLPVNFSTQAKKIKELTSQHND